MSQGSLQPNRNAAASNIGTGAGANSNRGSPAAQSTGPTPLSSISINSATVSAAAQSAQLAAAALGRVDHSALLAENIGSLYDAPELSDVTLVLDGTEFSLHRVILAARSQYFRYVHPYFDYANYSSKYLVVLL